MVREIRKSLKVREKSGNFKKVFVQTAQKLNRIEMMTVRQLLDGYYAIQLLLLLVIFMLKIYLRPYFLFLVFLFVPSFFIFDFHCDLRGYMKAEDMGRTEAVKRGKMSGENEFLSGKSR